jgi:FkbM family methyltransferase
MTVIDIGAHAGYYTFLFADLVGATGRVYAFEPHPRNFAILKRNVERHRLDNVTLIQKAVSDKNCDAIFYETALSMGHSLLPVKSYSNKIFIETVSLSHFLQEEGVKEVGLIKMDVEGGEPEVLKGISGLLKEAHALSIILEFKPSILLKRNYEPAELLKKLFPMDFEVFVIKSDGDLIRLKPDDDAGIIASIEKCNLLAQKSDKVLPT